MAGHAFLNIPGPKFDAAICLFDSIGYTRDDPSLLQTLRGVHEHLIPGGLFIVEFWHAEAMLQHYDPFGCAAGDSPGRGRSNL